MVGGQCLRLARATVVQEFGHMSPCNVIFFSSFSPFSLSFSSSFLSVYLYYTVLIKTKKRELKSSVIVVYILTGTMH